MQDVTATARNTATNLTVTRNRQSSGSYSISNLPAGTYELTFTKEGFEAERHTEVLVNGDRTTTVDGVSEGGIGGHESRRRSARR